MTTEGWISITILISIITCILGVMTFYFARKNDTKKDVSEKEKTHEELSNSLSKISIDIGWVKDTVGEIKATLALQSKEQSNIRVEIGKLDTRLQATEASVKELKNKLNH